MQVGIPSLQVERDSAAQVGLCFLKASQRIENRAEGGVSIVVIRALLYRDAGGLEGFRILFLPVQGLA